MMRRIAQLAAALAISAVFVIRMPTPAARAAGLCFVNSASTPPGSGTSWATAYTELASALTNGACQEVWVAGGLYRPGSLRSAAFKVLPGVELYGGFDGAETSRSQRKPAAHVTILSGDIDNNDTNVDGNHIDEKTSDIQGNNSYHVVVMDGTSTKILSDTVLDGFIITGGQANGLFASADASGAGLFCNGAGASHECSPTLSNLSFTGNAATSFGGALYARGSTGGTSSPGLTKTTFSGNSANAGAAMASVTSGTGGTSSPTLRNVTFAGNFSSYYGGAMYHNSLNGGEVRPVLTNVTFSHNTSLHFGGAIYNEASGTTLGIATPKLFNVIVWGDSAVLDGGDEIYNAVAAQTVIARSVVQGGCASIPGALCGAGNLSTDPKLGLLANNGGFTKTVALTWGSSAIDTGYDAVCPATDQRGVDRPQDGNGDGAVKCDIGATESRFGRATFRSGGGRDGWVLESGENTSAGGTLDSTATTIRIGDDGANRQYRGILSFNTSGIPDRAAVLDAALYVTKASLTGGGDPFSIFGGLLIDIRKGFFGSASALEAADFQAAASQGSIGFLTSLEGGGVYKFALASPARPHINKGTTGGGLTQFRLRFLLDDNNNGAANFISFYSGDFATTTSRPRLDISYYLP